MRKAYKHFDSSYIGLRRETRLAAQREALRRAEAGERGVSVAQLLREAIEAAPWTRAQATRPDNRQES